MNAKGRIDRAAKINRDEKSTTAATTLEFREFFEPGPGELKPSARLLSLNGKRVRLVGFMAQMEKPPSGAFYLCPRPVYSDESGGGTAELPVERVRVMMPSAKDGQIPFIARPVEVTGILEIGNREEEDGTVSAIRLVLDAPRPLSNPAHISGSKQKRKNSQIK